MDLLDFEGEALYFEEPLSSPVSERLKQAADNYEQGTAELPLLQAYFLAPESLTVLVGLYRFYFYQHRYDETLIVAERAMTVAGKRLHFPTDWHDLTPDSVTPDSPVSLVRFYLLALKGAAYLQLRLEQIDEGIEMLEKILALDSEDRLGASLLLATAKERKTT
jgi:tetratricopeptide (TPR) repeat protein